MQTRQLRNRLATVLIALGLPLASCARQSDRGPAPPAADDPVARAMEIAEAYVDGYFRDFTDQA
jgi:hypothetical protein